MTWDAMLDDELAHRESSDVVRLTFATELDELWRYAERIRAEVPILGDTATEDECRRRRLAIDGLLDEWAEESGDPRSGAHHWHSTKYADGTVAGCWAEDAAAAALGDMVWRGMPAISCIADPDLSWRRAWAAESGQVAVDELGALVPRGGLLDLLDEVTR